MRQVGVVRAFELARRQAEHPVQLVGPGDPGPGDVPPQLPTLAMVLVRGAPRGSLLQLVEQELAVGVLGDTMDPADNGGWQLAHACIAEVQATEPAALGRHAEEVGRFAGFREQTERSEPADPGLAVEVLRSGRPDRITDLTSRTDDPRAAAATAAGLLAVCAFPVLTRDGVCQESCVTPLA